MNKMIAMAVTTAILASGCSGIGDSRHDVVVLAPSSMADVLGGNHGLGFTTKNAFSQASYSFAGSNALVAQLRDGAQADVLITANRSTMERALAEGSVAGQPEVIARNHLVLAVADGNPGNISSLEDLGDPSKLIGLCAPQVPCGELSHQALDALAVAASPDTLEPNVRALAHKIKLGEVDAGLVYVTDALSLELTTVVSPGLDQFSTEYMVAAIHDNPDQGTRLLLEMMSAPGTFRAAMRGLGFETP